MRHCRHHFPRKRYLFIPFAILGLLALSGVVMWLWNQIIPPITGWGMLDYWHAGGLLILCKILFGGFGGHHHCCRGHHHHHGVSDTPPAPDRFMNLSEEEQQQFKDQWQKRCCR